MFELDEMCWNLLLPLPVTCLKEYVCIAYHVLHVVHHAIQYHMLIKYDENLGATLEHNMQQFYQLWHHMDNVNCKLYDLDNYASPAWLANHSSHQNHSVGPLFGQLVGK